MIISLLSATEQSSFEHIKRSVKNLNKNNIGSLPVSSAFDGK